MEKQNGKRVFDVCECRWWCAFVVHDEVGTVPSMTCLIAAACRSLSSCHLFSLRPFLCSTFSLFDVACVHTFYTFHSSHQGIAVFPAPIRGHRFGHTLTCVAWHPNQHLCALSSRGDGCPILLMEADRDKVHPDQALEASEIMKERMANMVMDPEELALMGKRPFCSANTPSLTHRRFHCSFSHSLILSFSLSLYSLYSLYSLSLSLYLSISLSPSLPLSTDESELTTAQRQVLNETRNLRRSELAMSYAEGVADKYGGDVGHAMRSSAGLPVPSAPPQFNGGRGAGLMQQRRSNERKSGGVPKGTSSLSGLSGLSRSTGLPPVGGRSGGGRSAGGSGGRTGGRSVGGGRTVEDILAEHSKRSSERRNK